jgi:DNA-binding GntR family transcriptional regulator
MQPIDRKRTENQQDWSMTAKKATKASAPSSRRVKRSQGLVEEVFQLIRADIMSLRIAPELGVSQTPIREALSMLEATGLVTKRHFVGYCSAPQLNRKQLDELYEVRLLIEPYAARCAATRMSDADLAKVRDLAQSMEPGESRVSYNLFADQDSELHDLIVSGSGNKLIQESLARLHSHLHIFRMRFHSEVTKEAYVEHAKLVDALTTRNPDMAEAAMRAHIEKSYNRLLPYARD